MLILRTVASLLCYFKPFVKLVGVTIPNGKNKNMIDFFVITLKTRNRVIIPNFSIKHLDKTALTALTITEAGGYCFVVKVVCFKPEVLRLAKLILAPVKYLRFFFFF